MAGILESYLQGRVMRQQEQRQQRQSAMEEYLRGNSSGIMSGDPAALSGLAEFDPMMAIQLQGQKKNQQRADVAASRADTVFRQGQEDRERAAAAERIKSGVSRALSLPDTPEGRAEFDRMISADPALQKMAAGYSDPFDAREAMARQVLGLVKQLEGMEPAKPLSVLGKQNVDRDAGLVTQEEIDAERTKTPLVDMSGMSFGGEAGSTAPAPIVPGQGNVEAGSGGAAFGLSGMLGGAANKVSDFVLGTEVAPQLADNQRFFNNLEVTALPIITQLYGRQPAQELMRQIKSTFANVGTFEGAQSALKDTRLLAQRFQADLDVAKQNLRAARRPAAQEAAQQRVLLLEGAVGMMEEALRRLEPAPQQNKNISDDVMKRLERY